MGVFFILRLKMGILDTLYLYTKSGTKYLKSTYFLLQIVANLMLLLHDCCKF